MIQSGRTIENKNKFYTKKKDQLKSVSNPQQ
jgi:hypothetical protein